MAAREFGRGEMGDDTLLVFDSVIFNAHVNSLVKSVIFYNIYRKCEGRGWYSLRFTLLLNVSYLTLFQFHCQYNENNNFVYISKKKKNYQCCQSEENWKGKFVIRWSE